MTTEGDGMERDQVEDMIAASEARTDTKFAELRGQISSLIEEIRHSRETTMQELRFVREGQVESRDAERSTRNTVLATAIPGFLALAALIIGLWQYTHEQPSPPPIVYVQPQQSASPPPRALPPPTQNNT